MSELDRPEPEPLTGGRLVLSWLWAISPAWSLGFLTTPSLLYGAVRHRHIANWLLAVVYAIGTVVMMVTASAPDNSTADTVFSAALAVNMFVATGHAMIIRSRVFSKRESPPRRSLLDAQRAVLASAAEEAKARQVAREISVNDPNRAIRLRIGRVDLPNRAFPDGGLIDINNVPRSALRTAIPVLAPYLDRLVTAREQIREFESVDDLSVTLGLPPHLLDHVADQLVFLPRYERGEPA